MTSYIAHEAAKARMDDMRREAALRRRTAAVRSASGAGPRRGFRGHLARRLRLA